MLPGVLCFHRVGGVLDLRQRARIDKRVEHQKLFFEIGAHRRLVVVGLGEIEGDTFLAYSAVFADGVLLGPGEGFVVAAANGDEEKSRFGGFDIAHSKSRRRDVARRLLSTTHIAGELRLADIHHNPNTP